ncbi:hypothetical protein [Gorillibacterium timonense]|uniref:hypothetical protein n=1 Tax=Gorillibacterium timonense TaxID=1689269 RepID=UPI00071CCCA5|nr:hypothetical protein [Gorillibacterium timonense]
MDKSDPIYLEEKVRQQARLDVQDDWDDKEKKKKLRKKRKFVVLTIIGYLLLLLVLYSAARTFAGFQLF